MVPSETRETWQHVIVFKSEAMSHVTSRLLVGLNGLRGHKIDI